VSRLGTILQAMVILQGPVATTLHHTLDGHLTNALWKEVKQVSHPLVMIVIMSMMMRESPP
jgi:DNA repair exonuclease SbcCD ATPase subunit